MIEIIKIFVLVFLSIVSVGCSTLKDEKDEALVSNNVADIKADAQKRNNESEYPTIKKHSIDDIV